MMTAHATVESAIEAMKLGALDYLQKPFEIDELLVVVNRAVDHQRLRTQHGYLLSERDEEFNQYGIVGRSRRIQDVIRTAEMVAKTKSTVLITGETGTGKEMVARAIHFHSAQRDMPLVKVNCAAIPENLLESELFGHVRGAFTGATDDQEGQVRAGRRRHRSFSTRSGRWPSRCRRSCCACCRSASSSRSARSAASKVDVRVIAATNRDIRQMVGRRPFPGGSLLPAERHPDPHSAAARAPGRHPAAGRSLRPQARAARRQAHRRPRARRAAGAAAPDWPGNVRELENTIERAVVLSPTPMIGADAVRLLGVASAATSGLPSMNLRQNLDWAERESVRRALESPSGVKKDAAEIMGISQRALSYYLAKHRWISNTGNALLCGAATTYCLIEMALACKERGAKDVYACVSHGVFSKGSAAKLAEPDQGAGVHRHDRLPVRGDGPVLQGGERGGSLRRGDPVDPPPGERQPPLRLRGRRRLARLTDPAGAGPR